MEEKDPMEEMMTFKTKDFVKILQDVYILGFRQCHIPMEATMKRVLELEPDLSILSKFLDMMDKEIDNNN
tara:strand:+ start:48 stop:257 length:210 start_codon:yes stop_codon:yes gene_type:complete